jgi:surface antigen
MTIKSITSAALVVLLLGACANYQDRPKETGGALVGAGLGALAGSQVGSGKGQLAAVAIGALAGAFLGSEVGKSLDKADRLYASRAQEQAHAAPIGQPIAWDNPKSGNSGTFTPTREGTHTTTGDYCREYQTTINVGGKTETAYGTACRQQDGSWKIVQ